jgi:hypothetical protein
MVLASGLLLCAVAGAAGASASQQKAQAQKTLLVLSDMPKGWTGVKHSSSGGGNFPGAKQLASCIGVPSNLITSNEPQVNSPNFTSKDQTLEVDDNVSIFHSSKVANTQYAAISNAKTPACMASLMNGSFKSQIVSGAPKGTSVGTISVVHAASQKGTTAFAVGASITSGGVTLKLNMIMVFFIKGQLGEQVTYYGYGIVFPASLASHLTSVAVGRI